MESSQAELRQAQSLMQSQMQTACLHPGNPMGQRPRHRLCLESSLLLQLPFLTGNQCIQGRWLGLKPGQDHEYLYLPLPLGPRIGMGTVKKFAQNEGNPTLR